MQPWFATLPLLHLIHWTPGEHYHSARFEKGSRYYVIRLSKDLLEDWVITLVNGRIKSRLGQSRTLAFVNFSEGFEHFCDLAKIRHQRGYKLKTITCDNHLMLHLLPIMVYTKENNELSAGETKKSINQREHEANKTPTIIRNILPQAPSQQLGFAF